MDYTPDDDLNPLQLDGLWEHGSSVYTHARDCARFSKDENAWSDEVVRPLLGWSGESDGGFFDVVNV